MYKSIEHKHTIHRNIQQNGKLSTICERRNKRLPLNPITAIQKVEKPTRKSFIDSKNAELNGFIKVEIITN